ncbi:MAG: hypothetical protein NC930_03265, partial [Candidatus Omnitrophica bacterium]|nr:hypothetical protein [Candidatus Omnitrophota bacterium]
MGKDRKGRLFRDSFQVCVFDRERSDGDWLCGIREKAYRRFLQIGFPSRKHEDWKYSNLEPLLDSVLMEGDRKTSAVAKQSDLAEIDAVGEEDSRMVFLDGIFTERMSRFGKLPQGVILESLSSELRKGSD